MKRDFFKLDMDRMRGLIERIGGIGIRPRWVAVVLIAATAAYGAIDLSVRIWKAAGPSPKIEKAARPAEAATGLKPVEKKQPAQQGKPPLEAYQVIAARNLFGSTDKESAGTGGPLVGGDYEPSTLQLDLIGTIAGEDGSGCAIIDDRKKAKPYRVGDRIGDVTVVRIMRNSVVLSTGGHEEVLNMKVRQSQPRPPGGNLPASVAPSMRAGAGPTKAGATSISTIRDILNQAGARPHFESGKMDGFYIGRVAEGTLLKKFGLENGDIVEGINDQPLQKPDDILNLQNLKGTRDGRTVLKIKRQGRPMTLNLNMD